MGLRMVGPVIMKFGTPEQKAKYLPRIVSGVVDNDGVGYRSLRRSVAKSIPLWLIVWLRAA
jgi:hypothetical protein